jgi:hypothetical protein
VEKPILKDKEQNITKRFLGFFLIKTFPEEKAESNVYWLTGLVLRMTENNSLSTVFRMLCFDQEECCYDHLKNTLSIFSESVKKQNK